MENNQVRFPFRILAFLLSVFLWYGIYVGILVTLDSAFLSDSFVKLGLDVNWFFIITSWLMLIF